MTEMLAVEIAAEYAERCPRYSARCPVCVIWKAYDELVSAGPISEDEVSQAMHWADRYFAGLDGYPQFDRVIWRRELLP